METIMGRQVRIVRKWVVRKNQLLSNKYMKDDGTWTDSYKTARRFYSQDKAIKEAASFGHDAVGLFPG
jgi:hypothetical protein